jgi:hypothetical protein
VSHVAAPRLGCRARCPGVTGRLSYPLPKRREPAHAHAPRPQGAAVPARRAPPGEAVRRAEHARPESRTRGARSSRGSDVRPVTRLAASQSHHGGIGCRSMLPVPTADAPPNRTQEAESKRSADTWRSWSSLGIGGRTSQESPHYPGQPIQRPNSSWAAGSSA